MKALLGALVLACALSGAGCGRTEKASEVTPTPPPSLASDAEKLQQAQMKAAAALQSASPTATAPTP